MLKFIYTFNKVHLFVPFTRLVVKGACIVKVAVLANLKEDAPHRPDDAPGRWDDLDEPKTIQAIMDALQQNGHQTEYFPADSHLPAALRHFQPDICFNYAVGHYGESRLAQTPALLDLLGIPYTASDVQGMLYSHNKQMAKKVFQAHGLPTANFIVVDDPDHYSSAGLCFPLFVKPASEGSSVGVDDHAIVHNAADLAHQIQWAWSMIHAPILVEEYVAGREFTIGVLGDEALPVVEIVSPIGFYSHAQKEDADSQTYRLCPAPLTDEFTLELQTLARRAKQVLHLRDLCRMDLRLDANDKPRILEVNAIPLLYPDVTQASFVCAAEVAGYTYPALINRVLQLAAKRCGLG